MKVCVLQPDYTTTAVDYQYYDPPRDLQRLLPSHQVDHVTLNKLTTYKQLKALQREGYDIFVNLCEGYLEWEVPSIDVIHTLELLGLPYTGPSSILYDPPKELMKYVAYCESVKTPAYVLIENNEDAVMAASALPFPLFLKPAKAGDSLGIDENSLVHTKEQLLHRSASLLTTYDSLLAETYIAGREFTVLVAANPDGGSVRSFKPVEYIFPPGHAFKTYSLKTSELHPDANIPCNDPQTEQALRDAATKIFSAFNGVGYARLDFRMNEKKEIFFLEINFTCSVFYTNGYEGSADHILAQDGIGQQGFLEHIIAEGIARHKRVQKKYVMKGNAISGYGIYAKHDLQKNEIIFEGEGRSQRLITKKEVERNWHAAGKENFRRYAYPVSGQVYLLWSENPSEWAPQNHSCDANTGYDGLNVIALRPVKKGEELTLDYTSFLDETMQPFPCSCGSPRCRQYIVGTAGNSVDKRSS